MTSYQRKWSPSSIVAGLVLSALLVPQGMAYAELAGASARDWALIPRSLPTRSATPSLRLVSDTGWMRSPTSALGPMIAATIAPLLPVR